MHPTIEVLVFYVYMASVRLAYQSVVANTSWLRYIDIGRDSIISIKNYSLGISWKEGFSLRSFFLDA